MFSLLKEAFFNTLNSFVDLNERIHWLFWCTSIVIAFFVYLSVKSKTSFIRFLFHKEHWTSRSALVDYSFIFFNGLIKLTLLSGLILWGKQLHFDVNEWMLESFGIPDQDISMFTLVVLYGVFILLIGDFTYYLLHLALHKIPFLWSFHKVHHSATVLNPITQYRIHPVELWLNNLRYILLLSVFNGVFDYYSHVHFEPYIYTGVSLSVLLFNSLGANLRHSHIRLQYFNWLEKWLISPFQHQIHHSNNPAHFDKNMGSKLAIWDWLFGSLVRSKEVGEIKFGLGDEDKNHNSFLKNLWMPVKEVLIDSWRKPNP